MSLPKPSDIPDYFPDELPTYRIGQRVRHRRYGYRGVVVDFDVSCHADEAWYQANATQPNQQQPWYHVLVHDSTGNTYVAQENLLTDDEEEEITHPLVEEFFEGYERGSYQRNDTLWPSW